MASESTVRPDQQLDADASSSSAPTHRFQQPAAAAASKMDVDGNEEEEREEEEEEHQDSQEHSAASPPAPAAFSGLGIGGAGGAPRAPAPAPAAALSSPSQQHDRPVLAVLDPLDLARAPAPVAVGVGEAQQVAHGQDGQENEDSEEQRINPGSAQAPSSALTGLTSSTPLTPLSGLRPKDSSLLISLACSLQGTLSNAVFSILEAARTAKAQHLHAFAAEAALAKHSEELLQAVRGFASNLPMASLLAGGASGGATDCHSIEIELSHRRQLLAAVKLPAGAAAAANMTRGSAGSAAVPAASLKQTAADALQLICDQLMKVQLHSIEQLKEVRHLDGRTRQG